MFRRGGGFGGYGRVGWGAILHYVLHDKLAVGSTETLGRAGIQHRVWMTGNQPEHDPWLPRSCARAERAACIQCRTLVLLMSMGGGFRVWRLWWVRLVFELRSMARRGDRALRPMATHRSWMLPTRGPSTRIGTTMRFTSRRARRRLDADRSGGSGRRAR